MAEPAVAVTLTVKDKPGGCCTIEPTGEVTLKLGGTLTVVNTKAVAVTVSFDPSPPAPITVQANSSEAVTVSPEAVGAHTTYSTHTPPGVPEAGPRLIIQQPPPQEKGGSPGAGA